MGDIMSSMTGCARFAAVSIVLIMAMAMRVHAEEAVFSGTVVGDDGPVEGVSLYINIPDMSNPFNNDCTRIAMTESNGAFSFSYDLTGLQSQPGIVATLIVYHDGHAVGWRALTPDDIDRSIDITLEKAEAISGTVIDIDGRGISNATVAVDAIYSAIVRTVMPMRGSIPELTATTDNTGKFIIEGLPKNMQVNLTVTAPNYARRSVRSNSSGTEGIAVELVPEGRISGTVTSAETGEPVPDAKVMARNMDIQKHFSSSNAATNKRGEYEINGIEPGQYRVSAAVGAMYETPELASITIDNIMVEAGMTTENTDIELINGGLIRGTVTDEETGELLPEVLVAAAHPDWKTRISFGWVMTDEHGEFTLRTIPGKVKVYLASTPEGYIRPTINEKVVEVTDGGITDGTDYQLRKGLTVRGKTVGPDDEPVAGVAVRGSGMRRGWYGSVTSGDDGTFTISGLAEGLTFNVEADHAGKKLRTDATLSSDAGEEQVIRLEKYETSTLTGVVLDEEHKPLPGAEMYLMVADPNSGGGISSVQCKTGSNGSYVISDLVIGKQYSLTAKKENYADTPIPFPQLTPGKITLDDAVMKVADRWLEGTVRDNHGAPIPGAHIMINGSPSGFKEVITDKNGHYRFEGLVPFVEPRISIHQRNYGDYRFTYVETNKPKDFTLIKPERSLSGKVVNADNEPIEGVRVSIDPQQHESGLIYVGQRTDTNGRFSYNNVLDEEVDISVSHDEAGYRQFKGVKVTGEELTFTLAGPDTTNRPERQSWEFDDNSLVMFDGGAPELKPWSWANGEPVRLADLKGKVVVLDFWNCDSKRSVSALRLMQGVANGYRDKGVVVIGIHEYTDDADAVKEALNAQGVSYPVLIDSPSETDGSKGATFDAYGINHYSFNVVIGSDGEVHPDVHVASLERELRDILDKE